METLAIATWSFGHPSETFIHDHVRTIAPGKTILVCQDGRGAEQFGCPVLPYDLAPAPETSGEWVEPDLSSADRSRLGAFFGAYQPAAVLAEYGPIGCLFGRFCQETAIPLYVHFHGFDASSLLRDPRQVRCYRALFQTAAGIIAPSRFLADKLAGVGCPEDKLHVSPCGFNRQRFIPTSRLAQRIIAVGRLVDKKAPHLTIQAFGRIAARFPEARLDMVGGGPLADRCTTLISHCGLDGRVHMHGVQGPDFVAQLMGKASMFVQHSVTAIDGEAEGLPVAILEAMGSALPIVATRHSGIPEAVQDGITGLLVDEYDVGGMAAAISELLDDPDRAAAMGAAARVRALELFTQEHTRDRLRAIIGFADLPPAHSTAQS